MDAKHCLKYHAYQNVPLTFGEAYELGRYALEGCLGNTLAQIQSIAVLCALHTQATYAWKWSDRAEQLHGHRLPQSGAEQIAGLCAAIFQHDIAVSPSGYLGPNIAYAMDNCGMGGDLIVTPNVSTLAAFIAAAAGIAMCKHGSPANADNGRHGSSDFVSLLGINTCASKQDVIKCLEREGFGYTEALDTHYKRIHLQTHEVAMLPHMNDIIGPVTNPLHPRLLTRRVLGVNHLISPRVAAEAYRILNERGITSLQHAFFVRGFADSERVHGMDEVSLCEGGTQVAELLGQDIREYHLSAEDFGLRTTPAAAISPPRGMSKGAFSQAILEGEVRGSALEMVLANTALLFRLAGRSTDLRECTEMARAAHMSGAAYRKMVAVRTLLPKG